MSFNEKLRSARETKGYTQQEIADLMQIDKSTYCGYETGKRQPDVQKIKLLSKILGVSGDDLLETGYSASHFHAKETADSYFNLLSRIRNNLFDRIREDPELPSCYRLKYLFDSSGLNRGDIIDSLGISHDDVESWIRFGCIPSRTIVDRFLGVFHLPLGMLCPSSELNEYYHYEKKINCVVLYGESGNPITKKLSVGQLNAIKAIIEQFPESPD